MRADPTCGPVSQRLATTKYPTFTHSQSSRNQEASDLMGRLPAGTAHKRLGDTDEFFDADTDSDQEQTWVSRLFALFKQIKPSNKTSLSKATSEQDTSLLPLINRLKFVFQDKDLCKRLVQCQASDAQRLLDIFQQLLDWPELDLQFRRGLIIATQRVSSRLELSPTCYKLDDVVQIGEYPEVSGGFADVYKGVFREQVVAIKAIRRLPMDQTEHTIRVMEQCIVALHMLKFWKEAMLWGQLSHPNVLTIYGIFLFQNRVSIVSTWMKNEHITKYLKQNPDAPRALLAVDVGSGLSYLHAVDIIHGDLKGVEHFWPDLAPAASKEAPELLGATEDFESETSKEGDVYALACVCYEIFTGQIPFARFTKDSAIILQLQLGAIPERPEATNPAWRAWGLTEKIWLLMVDCWERDTSKRPSAVAILDTTLISPQEFRGRMRKSFETMTVEELNDIINNGAGTPVLGMDTTDSARYILWLRMQQQTVPDLASSLNPSNDDQREGENPYLGPAVAPNKRAKTGFTHPTVFGDTQDSEKRVVIAAYDTLEAKSRRPFEAVVTKSHVPTENETVKNVRPETDLDIEGHRKDFACQTSATLTDSAIPVTTKPMQKEVMYSHWTEPNSIAVHWSHLPKKSSMSPMSAPPLGPPKGRLMPEQHLDEYFTSSIQQYSHSHSGATTNLKLPTSGSGASQRPSDARATYGKTDKKITAMKRSVWKASEKKVEDTFLDDPRDTDIVIPIMGPTGAGKSTPAKTSRWSGHKLKSETAQLQHVILPHPTDPARHIIVVDTPGFDDTYVPDSEILNHIAAWLARSYPANMTLAGVIYLHEISQTRFLGTVQKNLDMFNKLIGRDATKNVVLATTKWGEIPHEVGGRREEQLREHHWMVDLGAKLLRFTDSRESGWAIIQHILDQAVTQDVDAVEIQQELVEVKKILPETEAGQALLCTLEELWGN
ncbi:hypothetical protein DXG01_009431 [Tephrocybe rancida]|nr:hypothetical protein DXG01_009431 [Tephrocybe rancida]